MGAGLPPSAHRPHHVDRGTNALIDTPRPRTVGLDSKRPPATKSAGAGLAHKMLAFARSQVGQKDGDGECTTLVEDALEKGKAKGVRAFGKVGPDTDYKWGTPVSLPHVRPGDVIQFRDYVLVVTIVTETRTGNVIHTGEEKDEQTRPHHTALVEKVMGDGGLTVLEQNVPPGEGVTRRTLYFKSHTKTSHGKTTTVKVQGRFWFYRPQSR